MSSRREVLIRIALLQRKTLIETKNRTLKSLKLHYSIVRSMKNVAVLTEDRAFALLFRPHPWGFDSSRIPTPENLLSKQKKKCSPRPGEGGGTGRSWNWLMHYEGENFSDSSFHHIFESENLRFPFFFMKNSLTWRVKCEIARLNFRKL